MFVDHDCTLTLRFSHENMQHLKYCKKVCCKLRAANFQIVNLTVTSLLNLQQKFAVLQVLQKSMLQTACCKFSNRKFDRYDFAKFAAEFCSTARTACCMLLFSAANFS
jgi:hypothetical protein